MTISSESGIPYQIISSMDKKDIYLHDSKGISLIDLKTGKVLKSIKGDLSNIYIFNNNSIYIQEKDNISHVYYMDKDLNSKEILRLKYKVNQWGLKNNNLTFSGTPFTDIDQGSETGLIEIYDFSNLKLKYHLETNMVTEPLNFDYLYDSSFQSVDITPDGNKVAFTTKWVDGWKMGNTISNKVFVYDLKENKMLKELDLENDEKDINFINNNSLYINNKEYNLGIEDNNNVNSGIIAIKNFYKDISSHKFDSLISSNLILNDNHLKIELKPNNLVDFYDLRTNNKILSFNLRKNNEIFVYTPDNYYDYTLENFKDIMFKTKNNLVALSKNKSIKRKKNLFKNIMENFIP